MNQKLLKGIFSITGLISAIIFITLLTGTALAATDSKMDMNSGNTTTATPADKDAFVALWKKAFAAAMFTPDQLKRLSVELDAGAQKLGDNYMGLSDLLKQKDAAKNSDTTNIQKRIDLKEAERDLIASQVKVKLEEFLTKEQVNLILMAGFHGISMSMSGDEHLNQMHGGMNQDMDATEQTGMDLGKLAGKLNQNCQAVTLDLIRASFSSQTMM